MDQKIRYNSRLVFSEMVVMVVSKLKISKLLESEICLQHDESSLVLGKAFCARTFAHKQVRSSGCEVRAEKNLMSVLVLGHSLKEVVRVRIQHHPKTQLSKEPRNLRLFSSSSSRCIRLWFANFKCNLEWVSQNFFPNLTVSTILSQI